VDPVVTRDLPALPCHVYQPQGLLRFCESMKRDYRPRASKDRAVAQRVVEELERERVQEFSLAKKLRTDSDTIPTPSKASPSDAADQGSTEESERTGRRSLERRRRTKGQGHNTGGRGKGTRTRAKAGRGAKDNFSAETSPSANGELIDNNLLTEKKDEEGRGMVDEAAGNAWNCVSCSFLNHASARQCRMCSTKNRRARQGSLRGHGGQSKLGAVLGDGIGRRVEVKEGDGHWRSGSVLSCRGTRGLHEIAFDDSDERRRVMLSTVPHNWLDATSADIQGVGSQGRPGRQCQNEVSSSSKQQFSSAPSGKKRQCQTAPPATKGSTNARGVCGAAEGELREIRGREVDGGSGVVTTQDKGRGQRCRSDGSSRSFVDTREAASRTSPSKPGDLEREAVEEEGHDAMGEVGEPNKNIDRARGMDVRGLMTAVHCVAPSSAPPAAELCTDREAGADKAGADGVGHTGWGAQGGADEGEGGRQQRGTPVAGAKTLAQVKMDGEGEGRPADGRQKGGRVLARETSEEKAAAVTSAPVRRGRGRRQSARGRLTPVPTSPDASPDAEPGKERVPAKEALAVAVSAAAAVGRDLSARGSCLVKQGGGQEEWPFLCRGQAPAPPPSPSPHSVSPLASESYLQQPGPLNPPLSPLAGQGDNAAGALLPPQPPLAPSTDSSATTAAAAATAAETEAGAIALPPLGQPGQPQEECRLNRHHLQTPPGQGVAWWGGGRGEGGVVRPRAALGSRLDFSGMATSVWEVLTVRLIPWAEAAGHYTDDHGLPMAGRLEPVAGEPGPLPLAVLLVGHMGGTSVWVLKEGGVVCSHI
ncbi:unnamed protein product, partial [Discosporangium mesarthrocarpum]